MATTYITPCENSIIYLHVVYAFVSIFLHNIKLFLNMRIKVTNKYICESKKTSTKWIDCLIHSFDDACHLEMSPACFINFFARADSLFGRISLLLFFLLSFNLSATCLLIHLYTQRPVAYRLRVVLTYK